MCTVSWLTQAGGYVLLCNRDERYTRRPALGPRLVAQRGVSFIAPADGDHGGSWIGVNHFGLTMSLLNRYGDSPAESAASFTSRGLLLTALLDCEHAREVYERVQATQLGNFQPFTMAVLSPDEKPLVLDWTGHDISIRPEVDSHAPLVSSSLQEPQISVWRKEQFRRMLSETGNEEAPPTAELLWQFHRSHLPERGPYSVCMHREDASTVSLSVVTVTQERVEFVYRPGAPCIAAPAEKVSLARVLSVPPVVAGGPVRQDD